MRALAFTTILLIPFAGSAPAAAQAASPPAEAGRGPVQAGVRIAPDTVRVGQPFLVILRVRAARTATVVFPAGPDSGGAVEALDPRALAATPGASSADFTATYRLAAWDLGRQSVTFAPALVRGAGADQSVSFGDLTILVTPTTPADAAHRVPRAARAMFSLPRSWWPAWEIAAAALAILLVLWLIARWWRRRPRHEPPAADPFADASRDFGALERLGLLDAGEPGRYVALSTGITRAYLVRRLAPAAIAFTSAELVAALAEDRRVPRVRLEALLVESDRVKFARDVLPAADARALGADARRLVEEVEQRVAAAEAAAAQAAATPAPAGPRSSASGTRGRAA
jgi:hypothetical protein